jgi:hypothetical protein
MKLKSSLLVVLSVFVCGCAMQQPRMNLQDLQSYKIDCANKYAQIEFLQSQLPSQDEKMIAVLTDSGLAEFWAAIHGETTEARKFEQYQYEAAIKDKIWNLKTHCADAVDLRQMNQ